MSIEEMFYQEADCKTEDGTICMSKEVVLVAMGEYAKQEAIEFLEFATGRNIEISLGVMVDSFRKYDSIDQIYELYLQSKNK